MPDGSVSSDKPVKDKKIIIIIIVALIIIISLGIVFYLKSSNHANKNETNINETTEPIVGNYEYKIYYKDSSYYDENNYYYKNNPNENWNGPIKIGTDSKNVSMLDYTFDKYILYHDSDAMKIYNVQEKKSIVLNDKYMRYDEISYELVYASDKKELLGYMVKKGYDSIKGFYSLKQNKMLYKDTYSDMILVDDKYLSGLVSEAKKDKAGYRYDHYVRVDLLSTSEEKIVKSEKCSSNDENEDMLFSKSNNFYVLLEGMESGQHYKKIYDENLNEILSFSTKVYYYNFSIGKDKNIYVMDKNIVNVYDKTGKLIKKIDSYDTVYRVFDKYIVAKKDSTLIVTTKDGEDKEISTLNGKKVYFSNSYLYENDMQEEIIIEVIDTSVSKKTVFDNYKNDKDTIDRMEKYEEYTDCNYGYQYIYDLKTKNVSKKYNQICLGMQ